MLQALLSFNIQITIRNILRAAVLRRGGPADRRRGAAAGAVLGRQHGAYGQFS